MIYNLADAKILYYVSEAK